MRRVGVVRLRTEGFEEKQTIAGQSMHEIPGGYHLESLKHLAVARSSSRGIIRSSKSGASEAVSSGIAEVSSSGIVGESSGAAAGIPLRVAGAWSPGISGIPPSGIARTSSPEIDGAHRRRSTEVWPTAASLHRIDGTSFFAATDEPPPRIARASRVSIGIVRGYSHHLTIVILAA